MVNHGDDGFRNGSLEGTMLKLVTGMGTAFVKMVGMGTNFHPQCMCLVQTKDDSHNKIDSHNKTAYWRHYSCQ